VTTEVKISLMLSHAQLHYINRKPATLQTNMFWSTFLCFHFEHNSPHICISTIAPIRENWRFQNRSIVSACPTNRSHIHK